MGAYARDGYSCELNFLTSIPFFYNNNDRDNIWNQLQGTLDISNDGTVNLSPDQKDPKIVTVFKNSDTNRDLKNYYKDTIYSQENNGNPYIKLLNDFSLPKFEAVHIDSADFAYLSDLGVYPINRLWILRRFREYDVVPDNLLDWDKDSNPPYPIATLIGWIPPGDNDFFGVDFNEGWTTQKDRIDEVLTKMLKAEFGMKSDKVLSVPGWGQGMLMAFLHTMGASNFTSDEIPFGNPNVLDVAATRVGGDPNAIGYNLSSSIAVTLKTSFEQKFIGEVDPGSAMLDILGNLTKMGTSDVVYIANKNAEIFKSLRQAGDVGNSGTLWLHFIIELIDAFFKAIKMLLNTIGDELSSLVSTDDTNSISGVTGDSEGETLNSTTSNETVTETGIGLIDDIMKSDFIKTILASTTAKWKWPLRAGMGAMTGENTTPWHLTIGNPYSPFVSLGNIVVKKIDVKFKNDLSYNDMPKKIDVNTTVELGRPLGAQEIFGMFNNGYNRVYDKKRKQEMSTTNIYRKNEGSGNSKFMSETRVSTPKNK